MTIKTIQKLILSALVILAFFAIHGEAEAAGCTGTGNCYWVGGTGNANDTTKWATTDGGATTGGLPGAGDNCNFTANSSTANAAYTFTVNAATTCLDFVMAGPGAGNNVTWAGSSTLAVSGSMNLSAGSADITRTYTGIITFNATSGTKTLTMNGVELGGGVTFNGAGGTFQLVDDLVLNSGSITLTNGSFDATTNSAAVTLKALQANIVGAFTFYDFSYLPAGNSANRLLLSADIVVAGTFTVTGANGTTQRAFLGSSVNGTARTITAATVAITNSDIQDITGAGAGDWDLSAVTGLSGDCGGNSGITFTTPTTQHFINVDGGTFSTAANWTSRVPLPQDTALMDLVFGTSKTVTNDIKRFASMDWSDATWTTALSFNMDNSGGITPEFYGDFILVDNLTLTGGASGMTLRGRGSHTLTGANLSINRGVILDTPGGTYTLGSNFTIPANRTITMTLGTLSAVNGGSNYVISAGGIVNLNVTGSVITLGSATHLLTGTGNVWSVSGALLGTVNAGTSTLKITDTSGTAITFAGGGKTYNNIWFDRGASTGSITISGSNTFAEFKDTGTAAHSLIFTASTTQTVTTFTVSGTSGNVITLDSTTTTDFNLVKSGGGTVSSDYLNIQNSDVTPSCTWFAGVNSVNNQVATGGTGWTFTAPVACANRRIINI